MSDLRNQTPAKGSVKGRKRIGRGQGSGQGRQAGKGMKGYQARAGSKLRPYLEGGQMPLQRRLPKGGFSNYAFKETYQVVNLSALAGLEVDTVTPEILHQKGMARRSLPVKILGGGEIDKAVEVSAHRFSQSAIEKIEKAGGKAITL